MDQYQVISRKYRPQSFCDVVEQSPIVTTLKNAILQNRVASAYLFSGCRGTGKTTLARLFAKAINCENRLQDAEPCNSCSSCKEITSGVSLDVLEIDGASNRGIDDIRQLNENSLYASSGGRSKIYIIDEVHMLTKEAFNALLKTLEEPPQNVKFFFATTEPHKVLPTILSRCQKFDLKRLSLASIQAKLEKIAGEQGVSVEKEAISLIAKHADGSLRDAESMLDQALCSLQSPLSYESVADLLGVVPKDLFFTLDASFAKGALEDAFSIAAQIYTSGKEISSFIEALAYHFRSLLLCKLGSSSLLSEDERGDYISASKNYTKQQCLSIIEYLTLQMHEVAKFPWKHIHLEMILLHILRQKNLISLDSLVERLTSLEKEGSVKPHSDPASQVPAPIELPSPIKPERVVQAAQEKVPSPPPKAPSNLEDTEKHTLLDHQKHERLLRFASVELNGSVKK